jgi:hypothetical protein
LIVENILNISYELESREFNGKWYTDVKAWKIEMADNAAIIQEQNPFVNTVELEEDEGLPF